MNPFVRFLDRQPVVVLDGGLATALEARGHDLNHHLWSARLLIDAPHEIAAVTTEYLEAGADCVATATYQATFEAFAEIGVAERRATELFERAVAIAVQARDAFWSDPANRVGRLKPLVAASIGPFGAYLADGSEYSGRYGMSEHELYEFHERRFRLLADSPADLVAFETIPSRPEVEALLQLVADHGEVWAWLSMCCSDGAHLWDGSSVAEAARACQSVDHIAAVGVNCVAPEIVPDLVASIRSATDKPVLAYPNSGEAYDAHSKAWDGEVDAGDLSVTSSAWLDAGARIIGGCCRVGPDQIREIRSRLVGT